MREDIKMRDEKAKDWNEGHPDHEGEMAVSQLHRISEMANMLLDVIGENDELPGWVQYKISRSYTDLNDAFGYIESNSHDLNGYDYIDLEDDDEEEFELDESAVKRGRWVNKT